MVAKLFTHLEHAPDYDRNPKVRILAQIGEAEYWPEECLSLIGLYGGKYVVTFERGESTRCACVQPVEEITHG